MEVYLTRQTKYRGGEVIRSPSREWQRSKRSGGGCGLWKRDEEEEKRGTRKIAIKEK